MFSLLASCSYTSTFRWSTTAQTSDKCQNKIVLLTLSSVEHRPGMRKKFFNDTKKVIKEIASQPGLVGYAFKFELFGNKAWTMSVWENELSQKQFVKSTAHSIAVKNSRFTAQNIKFFSQTISVCNLPIKWSEAIKLLKNAPEYGVH
jgi:predicted amino acid racemase